MLPFDADRQPRGMAMDEDTPEKWSELDERERRAIKAMAESQLFWSGLFDRFQWLGSAAQFLLAIAAAYVLLREFGTFMASGGV